MYKFLFVVLVAACYVFYSWVVDLQTTVKQTRPTAMQVVHNLEY